MNTFLKKAAFFSLSLGVASQAFASNAPGSGSITAHTATTISASVQNSASGANPTNSLYYFEATTGSPSNTPDTANGTVVIVGVQYFGGGTATDVIAGIIKPVVGGTTYNVYVKACPPGATQSDVNCSAWVSLGSVGTDAYPTNPGFQNISSADTAPRQFTSRTSNVGDATDIVAWQLTVNNSDSVLGAGSSALQTQQPFSGVANGGNGSYLITSAVYNSLLPNLGYTATERLIYFYNKPGPNLTISQFFTQPVDPVAGNVSAITHCSATLDFQNTSVAPANPADSPYEVNIGGSVSSGSTTETINIGGSNPSSSNSVTFTNLRDGQTYNPTVIVRNRGGASWRPSNSDSFNSFQTLAWNGSFSVTNETTNGATFNVLSLNTAGVISWQLRVDGNLVGSPTAGTPPATIAITGLNPNTSHTVQIRLSETGCASEQPVTPISFYTRPAAPTGGSLSASGPRSLLAGWTDANPPTGNPSGATYTIQRCTNAGFSAGCQTQSATKNSTSMSATVSSGIVPETQYFVRVKTVSASGNASFDSAWLDLGNATTPNEAPSIVSGPSVQVFTTSATLTVTATDNGALNQLVFNWTVNAGAGNPQIVSAAGTSVINGQNVTNTAVLTFSASNNFSGSVTVTDKNGSGLQTSGNWNTSGASLVPTTVDPITPNPGTVVVNAGTNFSATIRDQFGAAMTSGLSGVTWTLSNGAASNTPVSNSTYTKVTGVNSTLSPTVLTVRLPNNASRSVNITVLPSGPVFTSGPTLTLNPDGKTATASASAVDSSPGAGTMRYSWTLESGPSAISVSPANPSTSGTATITFSKAGTYVLRCTLNDNFATDGSFYAVTNSVIVVQTLSGISVSPNNITIRTLQNQQFTANGIDQFGDPMTVPNVTWSTTGGNVSGTGSQVNFNSAQIGTRFTITARSGNLTGAASVNVISYDVTGAHPFPVPFKGSRDTFITFTGIGNDAEIKVYTASGREVFSTHVTPSNGEYQWNVKNTSGENLASGVYFFRIKSPDGKKDGKLIIIR